ncbi:MAG: MFS transporter [Spirochaetales bacterium]|nr:MFS transporter [Spirochaetales bacterium]
MGSDKLKFSQKLGYASGIVSESVLYNMFYTYFIIFLTDVALVNPALAGTISLISVLWDGITDPLIGHYADRKEGRKRKLLLFSALPMALFFILSFFPVQGGAVRSFLFYTISAMLFWLFYTMYTIPYYALGAEITQDYDERTRIRGLSGFINSFAIFIGCALPTLLVGALMGKGISVARSWSLSAGLVGLIGFSFVIITWFSLRRIKLVKSPGSEVSHDNILRNYMEIIRLKPFRYFVIYIVFYMVSSSISQANLLYLIQYRAGLDPDFIGFALVALIIGFLVFTPITTRLGTKYDRRTAIMIMFSLSAAGMLVMKGIGVDSAAAVLALSLITGISAAAFWGTFYSFAYDLVEIDEMVNGIRREGAITALPQFLQKFGAALGLWFEGLFLSALGYNASLPLQSPETRLGIESVSTIFLAGMTLIAVGAMYKYPVTKERFLLLERALQKKKSGEVYSTEGLEDLIDTGNRAPGMPKAENQL